VKLLFIAPDPPYPETSGGRMVVFNTIKHLARRGHEIDLLFLAAQRPKDDDLKELGRWCRPFIVPHGRRTTRLRLFLNLFESHPYSVQKYRSRTMVAYLRELLARQTYDVIQLEGLFVAYLAGCIRRMSPTTPLILRQHNVETTILERLASSTGSRVGKPYLKLQARRLAKYEGAVCGQFDLCIALTPVDQKGLQALAPGARIAVVPAGIDTDYFAPADLPEEPATLLFIGAMDYLPNAEGILWFCKEVLPLIKEEVPQVRLYVVGRSPRREVARLASEGIQVTGFVDDVRDYLAKAQVFIVPLLSGSGMRVKILSALAMQRAVVTTTIGCEGIPVVSGKHLIIADNAEDFARSVVNLLHDPSKRASLGWAGRQLVLREYSWERVVGLVEDVYHLVLKEVRGD